MFETVTAAEIIIPDELKDHGEQAWWYVRNRLHMRWFHATCAFSYGNDQKDVHMLFLTQIDHLLEVKNEETITILEVDLVSPRHMNNGERWNMEPLSEILVGYEPDTEYQQDAHIFVLSDGTRYVDSGLSTKEDDLLNKKTIFTVG